MSQLELEVYEIFKNRFSDKEAAKVIELLEEKAEQKIAQKKDVFMTKDDKVDLITRIETSKTDTIKWMFIFWIGQLAATAGILFAVLNAYLKR
jgi:1,2-phenylacetyl-CoA epoxidase PaaB subunit